MKVHSRLSIVVALALAVAPVTSQQYFIIPNITKIVKGTSTKFTVGVTFYVYKQTRPRMGAAPKQPAEYCAQLLQGDWVQNGHFYYDFHENEIQIKDDAVSLGISYTGQDLYQVGCGSSVAIRADGKTLRLSNSVVGPLLFTDKLIISTGLQQQSTQAPYAFAFAADPNQSDLRPIDHFYCLELQQLDKFVVNEAQTLDEDKPVTIRHTLGDDTAKQHIKGSRTITYLFVYANDLTLVFRYRDSSLYMDFDFYLSYYTEITYAQVSQLGVSSAMFSPAIYTFNAFLYCPTRAII